jgi:DNA polymerase-1
MSNILEHIYLIDGSGFIFRAFHALPPMSRPDGLPVNAVFGFTNMIMKLLENTEVDHLAVIFDSGRRNFRHDIYPAYKAHRPPVPDDLIPQFSLIRAACKAFNVPTVEAENFEADDLIATYSTHAVQQGAKVTIVSSDKDLMQLIDDHTTMLDPLKNMVITPKEVIGKFGVPPRQVRDVQALAGDSSDNIPGVPGIGLKTAAQLIIEFGNLENLLGNLERIPQPKRRASLIENVDNARISYKLVSLCREVPRLLPLESFERKIPVRQELISFLEEQNFRSILARIEKRETLESFSSSSLTRQELPLNKSDKHYELILQKEELERWISEARHVGIVAFDTETTSLEPLKAELVGFSLCIYPQRACYVPVGHTAPSSQTLEGIAPSCPSSHYTQLPLQEALQLLKPLLSDPTVLKVGHNIKYDALVLLKYGIEIAPFDDTMVMSYSLDGAKHGHSMDELASLHYDYTTIKYKDVTGTGRNQITFDQVPLEQARDYAAEDAEVTLALYNLLKPRLVSEHVTSLYEYFDRPLIPVLIEMEYAGIKVDAQVLKNLSYDFSKRLTSLEEDIYRLAGRAFNIGSPKQLSEILFQELGFETGKKGKSGSFSTNVTVLEDLALQGHALPEKILEWRQLSKLKNTYTDALIEQINPKTGRVHTNYSSTITLTGRLASSHPNLQNIPIRTEEGRKIRAAFIAKEGHKLISLDYSQIELRLLAHMGKIASLQEVFRTGHDVHTATAAEVFGVPLHQVSPEQRRKAKAINFGIIYGMSAYGLARQLKISQAEAAYFIKIYNERYPEILPFMETQKQKARKNGYVETLFGRKCYISGINDQNPAIRGGAERQAINAPLQGTAADIMKKAMITLNRLLKEKNCLSKILLQVHDELVIESPEEEVILVKNLATEAMSKAVYLDVPLTVGGGIGKNWNETG